MGGWWVADAWAISPVLLVAWVFWVIFSITLHELGHGWAAIRLGDRTPIETGHMTWSPMVHMGPMSLLVFAIVGIAWGAMPVDPSRLRGRHGDAVVSAAGPAMNLLLAVLCVVGLALWGAYAPTVPDHVDRNMAMFLHSGAMLNVALMLFNLVPVPPLDGSRIVASFAPAYGRAFEGERGQMLGLLAFLGLFWFVGPRLFDVAGDAVALAAGLLASVLP